jgi:hypothetical protein
VLERTHRRSSGRNTNLWDTGWHNTTIDKRSPRSGFRRKRRNCHQKFNPVNFLVTSSDGLSDVSVDSFANEFKRIQTLSQSLEEAELNDRTRISIRRMSRMAIDVDQKVTHLANAVRMAMSSAKVSCHSSVTYCLC